MLATRANPRTLATGQYDRLSRMLAGALMVSSCLFLVGTWQRLNAVAPGLLQGQGFEQVRVDGPAWAGCPRGIGVAFEAERSGKPVAGSLCGGTLLRDPAVVIHE